MLKYVSTNDQWIRLAFPLASFAKTKPCQFSWIQFSSITSICTRLKVRCMPIDWRKCIHCSVYNKIFLENDVKQSIIRRIRLSTLALQ